ncbi:MAG: hypothetical protein IT165_16590 [Bryobacterales bacterium]|nr:hypothetical protein [Bryobacterales bacterium]
MFHNILKTSEARREANRANAQKSTGPVIEAGKAVSSKNALKEGFTASFAIVAPDEQSLYDAFVANYRAKLRPEGILEEDLFRRLLLASWNLRRIERLQHELYTKTGIDPLESDDPEIIAKLDRYARHQVLQERTYHRALKELRLLQDNRIAAAQLARTLSANTPPLADADAEAVSERSQLLKKRIGAALDAMVGGRIRDLDDECSILARNAKDQIKANQAHDGARPIT